MARASIIIGLWLSGCAVPAAPVAYDHMPGYLPAYPQYERPSPANGAVVLSQGGIAVCH